MTKSIVEHVVVRRTVLMRKEIFTFDRRTLSIMLCEGIECRKDCAQPLMLCSLEPWHIVVKTWKEHLRCASGLHEIYKSYT
jgi:hypothetical protein